MLYLIAGAVAVYALYALLAGEDRPSRSPSPRIPSRRRDDRQTVRAKYPPTPHVPSPRRDDQQPIRVERPPVETYASLRAKAKQEGDLMAQCYQQSQAAYERHDRALAKTLSDQGKRHAHKMESLNAQASAIVFKENNQDRPTDEVDLHGLYVKEAISYAEKAIKEARRRGDSEIRLIVGQGNHSDGGISRLKPALQEAMRLRGVHVDVDPRNGGVLQLVLPAH